MAVVKPVIDLLRESVELDPSLAGPCGDECDPVNDPKACLASQIAWALEHGPGYDAPAPVHVHAWQPGPVIEWRYVQGYNNEVHDPRPAYRVAERGVLVCACGSVRPIILRDVREGNAAWPETVTL